jgi:hypothetical protein
VGLTNAIIGLGCYFLSPAWGVYEERSSSRRCGVFLLSPSPSLLQSHSSGSISSCLFFEELSSVIPRQHIVKQRCRLLHPHLIVIKSTLAMTLGVSNAFLLVIGVSGCHHAQALTVVLQDVHLAPLGRTLTRCNSMKAHHIATTLTFLDSRAIVTLVRGL